MVLNETTGLPNPFYPIHLVISTTNGRMIFDRENVRNYGATVRARTFTVSTHVNDVERQMRDTAEVVARTQKGSRWLQGRSIYQMEDEAEAAWLQVELFFGPGDCPPHGYDHEVAAAMAPLWASWWLCDIDADLMDAPLDLLAGAANIIALGTEWRTAVSMAILEDQQRVENR